MLCVCTGYKSPHRVASLKENQDKNVHKEGVGYWVLGTCVLGTSVLGAGAGEMCVGSWMLGAGCWVLGTYVLGAGCWGHVCWVLGVGCSEGEKET